MTKYTPYAFESSAQWKRMAKQAMQQAKEELDCKHPSQLDPGNPNHPNNDGLFGMATADFLARQYKTPAR